MAPAEKSPRAPAERNLNRRERDKLLGSLTELAIPVVRQLDISGRWPQLEPYVELTTMMGELRGNDSLKPSQQAYLRKMIALQTTRLPQIHEGVRAAEFLEQVQIEAVSELAQVETLPSDPSDYKRPWDKVFEDLLFFESQLKKIGS